MADAFAPYEPNQALLLPPCLQDWLPEGHLARFVSETVDQLDLKAFRAKYRRRKNGRGGVAYHPAMMLKVLIYAYCTGIFSSRRIAVGLEDLVPLRYLAAGNQPSHRTIARFRLEFLKEFEDLFTQVVRIAQGVGLVKMGVVAIDGTKLKADASKHKAMSYGRMKEEEKRLRAEIRDLTRRAQEADAAEDEEFGPDERGDELPAEIRRREEMATRIKEARERLEREHAEEERARREEDGRGGGTAGKDPSNTVKKPSAPTTAVPDKKQANFTDPESRIMGSPKKGFTQGYNAQIAVDGEMGLIIAADVTACASDAPSLIPMVEQTIEVTGRKPEDVLADAGYRSEKSFVELESIEVRAHVALARGEQDGKVNEAKYPATARMAKRRRTKRSQKLYRLRKTMAEAPFGWTKRGLGFRGVSLRGLKKAQGEWKLLCLSLNVKRLQARMQWT